MFLFIHYNTCESNLGETTSPLEFGTKHMHPGVEKQSTEGEEGEKPETETIHHAVEQSCSPLSKHHSGRPSARV